MSDERTQEPSVDRPILAVISGLPGSGKTTISRAVADRLGATYLRVDSIETTLDHFEVDTSTGAGYIAAHAVAADQLRSARPVVVDAVNPHRLSRDGWIGTAREHGARLRFVEVICSDPVEHERRVSQRRPDLPHQRVPTWDEVLAHDYEPWTDERLVVDNVGDPADHVAAVLAYCAPERD